MLPVSSPKLDRAAAGFAVLALVILALQRGKPSFTNASRPPRGISDPGIALETVRTLGDVDLILGEAPSPDREVMRIKQYIDLGLIAAQGLFLTLALMLTRLGGWGQVAGLAAMICAVGMAAFDLIERRFADHGRFAGPNIRRCWAIRSAGAATWALAAVTLLLLSSLFRRSPVGLFLVITAGGKL